MNCKLSRASLIELRLIPTQMLIDDALCPCCMRPVIEHRYEIGLGKVPFTWQNLLPRLKRILRKSAVVSMIVGTVVAFVILALGTLVNHLMTIYEKNRQEISDHLKQYQQKSSKVDYNPHARTLIKNNTQKYFSIVTIPHDNYNDENLGLLLGLISFCLCLSLILISLILWRSFSSKSSSIPSKREEHDGELGILMPINMSQSVFTQIAMNTSDQL
ncbi:unnamed protein product [Rotaria sp. Silwood2]|nr:unnamed protein product [Rotaria sp. Silwood2]CAF4327604.1 unnamed protein product [Rotaria sp. Silwood2]